MIRALGAQHRTTALLLCNQAINAVGGLAFWLVFIHVVGLDVATIGVGYTVVAMATAVGMVGRGGFATALLRHAGPLDHRPAWSLLGTGLVAAGAVAAVGAVAVAAVFGRMLHALDTWDWALMAAIALLLVVVWLQDAYLLARRRPGATVRRNLVFNAGKLALPFVWVALVLPSPVAAVWAGALLVSACVGWSITWRPGHGSRPPDRAAYLRSARRNLLGNAAEFLPGLVLVPLVMVMAGAHAAGLFGMAWTIASMLFLATAAIARSAMTQLVHGEPTRHVVKRALAQAALLVVPAALLGATLAGPLLAIFGSDYASAAPAMAILCLSALVLVPTYVYLDVLRAREAVLPLNLFPLALIALLALLAPVATMQWGVTGAAMAWLGANLPFGAWAATRLRHHLQEVPHDTETVHRHPHLE